MNFSREQAREYLELIRPESEREENADCPVGSGRFMHSLIDLHMHSTASDGKDTPAALWEKIRQMGIRCFSLTDHDTIDGAREMERLVAGDGDAGVRFIRGIEFSAISPAGKCHILGYGYDWDNDVFRAALEKCAELRRRKLEQRLDFLRREYRIVFAEEDMAEMRRRKSVGKPHLGELMVKQGVVDSVAEAIDKYINRCPKLENRMPADEVIAAIRAAGGISVWAHPYGGVGERPRSGEEFRAQQSYLREKGLQGLECFYSRFTPEQIDALTASASANGLCVSGGSDYHGRKTYPEPGTLNADGVPVEAERLSILGKLGESIAPGD